MFSKHSSPSNLKVSSPARGCVRSTNLPLQQYVVQFRRMIDEPQSKGSKPDFAQYGLLPVIIGVAHVPVYGSVEVSPKPKSSSVVVVGELSLVVEVSSRTVSV